MSGIFGTLNHEGRPAATDLATLDREMAACGPDGGGVWGDGPVGLGARRLHDTPESIHERSPSTSPDGQFVMTVEARLDDRGELCDALSISARDRSSLSDGRLCLLAYQTWGEQCLNRLLGDWSFAAWHPREQRLFLARDPQGMTGLYYVDAPRRFAFASDHRALLALAGTPRRLNELYLAQLLVACQGYQGAETIFHDLRRLPPAHALRIDRDGMRVWKYWELETSELPLRTEDEVEEQFLHLYRQAVRTRLRSLRPLGATLSGGLDSGSVVALAGEALASAGGERSLTAFTSVPRFARMADAGTKRFGDEWPLASLVARSAGVTDHVAVDGGSVSPLDGIRRAIALHVAPCHASSNQFWLFDLLDRARERGVGTLLIGQGGNATISWSGYRSSRPALRQLWRVGGISAVVKRLATDSLPRRWRSRVRTLWNTGEWRNADQPWRPHSAIHPAFSRRVRLADHMLATGNDPDTFQPQADAVSMRLSMLKPGAAIGGALWAQHAADARLSICDPTLDQRLTEFCIRVPDRFFRSADGVDRRVLRRAMAGRLPDEVRLNRRLGQQADDVVQRVRRQREEIEAELDSLARSTLASECLDLPYLRRSFEAILIRDDAAAKYACDTIVLRGLMTGMFLRDCQQMPAAAGRSIPSVSRVA